MNLQSLLQDDKAIDALQDIVSNINVNGKSGSGKIVVAMSGSKQVTSISIDSSLSISSPEQVKALESAIMVAVKDAEAKAENALVELIQSPQDLV